MLGDHGEQKGSFVSPDTLRFDFSHFEKVTDEQLREVSRIVNSMIREDIPLDEHRDTPLEEAKKLGAIALFGEKYGDKVRVVRFGPSCEFCGGIHASSTGRIGMFKIVSESSVAAGIRRIEAVTGKQCEEMLYAMEDTAKAIGNMFNNAKDLQGAIAKFIDEHEDLKKEVEAMKAQAAARIKAKLIEQVQNINGVNVIKAVVPADAQQCKDIIFQIREAMPGSLVCALGTKVGGKPSITVMLSDDMVKDHNLNAGKIVREAAKLIQGGGGGQPFFATAGGKNPDGISAALDKAVELCEL